MINLIQNTAQLILDLHDGDTSVCGQLSSPKSGYDVSKASALGMRWALDNGCFLRYEPTAIIEMLRKCAGIPNCLFMVAPDVVQNHDATLCLFWQWEAIIASYGYPVAFVLQNGATVHNVPFDACDCLFIGGDNAYKYSEEVRLIVKEAKARGLWVHAGRVNTIRRIRYCASIGCDSFDGTGLVDSLSPMRQRPRMRLAR